eukprot:6319394-Prymnesium_polylepis.1
MTSRTEVDDRADHSAAVVLVLARHARGKGREGVHRGVQCANGVAASGHQVNRGRHSDHAAIFFVTRDTRCGNGGEGGGRAVKHTYVVLVVRPEVDLGPDHGSAVVLPVIRQTSGDG